MNTHTISLKKATEELANIAGSVDSRYCALTVEMGTHDCNKIDRKYEVKLRLYIDGHGSFEGADLDELMSKVRDRIYGVKQTISDVDISLI
jgi:hypothetical protein